MENIFWKLLILSKSKRKPVSVKRYRLFSMEKIIEEKEKDI